ncbi:transcriptional regulator [Virgibacillus doumboii]|uniref:transcriptional regulator n=1 Tax=Virgibacillus doumboii TaxID=2697503 RepID=UPI0013DE975F|nr:transcriptional regulator [Virgibacillus doumboii]
MQPFEQAIDEWLQKNISEEKNPRRREILKKGLGHGSVELLRRVWYPAVGNFDHLYPEWEVRDFNGGYRYLDLAYMPGGAKGGIEVQGYGPHARDLDTRRFKDLCWRHSLLALDGWTFLPIAFLSIRDEPQRCQQLILAFIGKFISSETPSSLTPAETEIIRFARRILRPFTPVEVANHLNVSDRHARRLLRKMVDSKNLEVESGEERVRKYRLR